MTAAATYAVDELGEPVSWPMNAGHLLVVGTTGAGKSSVPKAVIAPIADNPLVQPVGIDLKAVELSLLKPRLSALAVERDEAVDLLAQLVAILGHRRRIAAAHGWTTWPASANHPYLPLLIDELAELTTAQGMGKAAESLAETCSGHIDRLGRLGRALGMPILAATQRGEARIVGGHTRSLFARRLVMASLDRASYAMGLGLTDNASLDHHIADLSVATPGVGLLLEPGRALRRVRAYWWPDDVLKRHLAQCANRTLPLDVLSELATRSV